jgi:hypothetical protein
MLRAIGAIAFLVLAYTVLMLAAGACRRGTARPRRSLCRRWGSPRLGGRLHRVGRASVRLTTLLLLLRHASKQCGPARELVCRAERM